MGIDLQNFFRSISFFKLRNEFSPRTCFITGLVKDLGAKPYPMAWTVREEMW